ncbi:hypothetical protein M6D93_09840 [Jatrophihabitans telluris]|uniref:DUF5666 domain-containing protein n=1 Tax=Jatrophihabitans telluris TaxID=2038343 RepID=A0ABY4QRY1_9ACTN|nr:hypothetical protein [Jatrophihabitans telluris]UQX86615.1 hypothetical protein M6D93_09840 [Jatrophihabitans telluris]
MNPEWTPPPAPSSAYPQTPRRKRGLIAAAGLVGVGAVAGAIIGATALSNAATPSTSPSSSSSSSSSSGSTSSTSEATEHHGGGLDLSGTVTAVGSSSVTIKTSTGTVQYAVSSSSDIDKNGESSLSKLVVGDAVTFSVDTVNNVKTIDKLHSGTESLNRPTGGKDNAGG